MKKRILLALFLVLCLTFVLCACGDGEGDKKIDVKPGTITNAPQG